MTRRSWWWIGILMLVGAVGGCGDDDHHHHHHHDCGQSREAEPNDTPRTADFLGEAFRGDCAIVVGSLSDKDVDTYRFLVQERLTLAVTLDHSAEVNVALQFFDADTGDLIRDCGSGVVPIDCDVRFGSHSHDIAVDAVLTSVSGAGSYTLTLDAQ
jgi:hypothetical protein